MALKHSKLRATAIRATRGRQLQELYQRVGDLEGQIAELRGQNLRLAEITDIVQELLIPMASRDQSRIDEAIEKFSASL